MRRFEVARERRAERLGERQDAGVLPAAVVMQRVGRSPRAASAAAAGSYDGGCAPHPRSSTVAPMRSSIEATSSTCAGLAVVRRAHHRQLALAEAEALQNAGAHRRRGDERLGRRAQEDGRLDRAGFQHDLAVDVGGAGGDVMHRLDARSAPHGDRRNAGQLPEHDGDAAFALSVSIPAPSVSRGGTDGAGRNELRASRPEAAAERRSWHSRIAPRARALSCGAAAATRSRRRSTTVARATARSLHLIPVERLKRDRARIVPRRFGTARLRTVSSVSQRLALDERAASLARLIRLCALDGWTRPDCDQPRRSVSTPCCCRRRR